MWTDQPMNIFATSKNPVACAQALDDKRVISQIRETGQLLTTALRRHGFAVTAKHDFSKPPPATAHPHHPVTKWVGDTIGNWDWTMEHFEALLDEKMVRWPDNEPHSYAQLVKLKVDAKTLLSRLPQQRTIFSNSAANKDLGLDFTHIKNVNLAYREYVKVRWSMDKREPKWTNRGKPKWA